MHPKAFPLALATMGTCSGGRWVPCYWCGRLWVWDPYYWAPESRPLCDACGAHFELHGQPPRPNAVDHRTKVLVAFIQPLNGDPDLARRIAEFLTDVYRPGQGSSTRKSSVDMIRHMLQ